MKIYIHYDITHQPWGGINSFLRAMKETLLQRNYYEAEPYKADIILIAASSAGINKSISFKEILNLRWLRYNKFFPLIKKRQYPLIVHRLDGLRTFYAGKHEPSDDLQLKLSKLADHIIFQSQYSLQNFRAFGYNKNNYHIIYNGTNTTVFSFKFRKLEKNRKIKIIASSWSNNIHKGFNTISSISLLDSVEVTFVGNWNSNVPPNKVKIIKPVDYFTLAKLFHENDVFLHAAQNDPCPNVVVEAMATGLPVLYNNSGGTPEIAHQYGIALQPNNFLDTLLELQNKYDNFVEKLQRDHYTFDINYVVNEYIKVFETLLIKNF